MTDWSFNDGVQTLNKTNSYLVGGRTYFDTDGQGNITLASFSFYTLPPVSDGSSFGFITHTTYGGDQVDDNATCVTASPDGNCSHTLTYYTFAPRGVWTDNYTPPIPTLTQWSLMLLALLLGMVGVARVRRQV